VSRKLLGVPNPHEAEFQATGGRLPREVRDYLMFNKCYASYEKETGLPSPLNIVYAANPLLTDICCNPLVISTAHNILNGQWPAE